VHLWIVRLDCDAISQNLLRILLIAVVKMVIRQVDQKRYMLIVFCNGFLVPLPGCLEITRQSEHRANQIQHGRVSLLRVDGVEEAALRFDEFAGCDEQSGQLCPGGSMSVIEADNRFQSLLGDVAVATVKCDCGGEVMRPDHVGLLGERFTTQFYSQMLIARTERLEPFFNELL